LNDHVLPETIVQHPVDWSSPGLHPTPEHQYPKSILSLDAQSPSDSPVNEADAWKHHAFAYVGMNKHPEMGEPKTMVAITSSSPCRIIAGANSCSKNVTVAAKSNITLSFISAVVTNATNPKAQPLQDAFTILQRAVRTAIPVLREHHETTWASRLAEGSISIDGDFRLAQTVNASLFGLRTEIRADGEFPHALSPGGLSSNGYDGKVYWGQETWMLPALMLVEPASVRAALQYRWDRREQADALASHLGERNSALSLQEAKQPAEGALRFPWESGLTGHELQHDAEGSIDNDPLKQHISGDIAIAARQYYYATGDVDWLREVGFPLVVGVASYFASRVTQQEDGHYGIHREKGTGPFFLYKNNSVYTNSVAMITLQAAIELATVLNETVPQEEWTTIAKGLVPQTQPVPPSSGLTGQYHPEFDGYPDSKDASGGKLTDAVLLQYPLNVSMPLEVKHNDLAWYAKNTPDDGPTMTWSALAINAMRLNDTITAMERFNRAYSLNVLPPFYVWTEKHDGGGCAPFITGAGGFLQAVVFGVLGLTMREDRLSINPPPMSVSGFDVTGVSLPSFKWHHTRLSLRTTANSIEISQLEGGQDGAPPLMVFSATGERTPLQPGGQPVSLPRNQGQNYVMEANAYRQQQALSLPARKGGAAPAEERQQLDAANAGEGEPVRGAP
jgi:trehalose/maltose hydrolase-like predicted phosphorylase